MVERGSLAHSEGIVEGDLIKEVNRHQTHSVCQFSDALQKISSGKTILLRVVGGTRDFLWFSKLNAKNTLTVN